MIDSFAQLKQSIYDYMVKSSNDSFFTTDRIDRIVDLAEKEMSTVINSRYLQKREIVDSDSNGFINLPNDYEKLISISNENIRLNYIGLDLASEMNLLSSQSETRYYTLIGSKLQLLPTAEITGIVLDYYSQIPSLSTANPTNDILSRYPDLYLYFCLKHAFMLAQDTEQESQYTQRAYSLLEKVNKDNIRKSIGSGAVGFARAIG